MIIPIMQQSVFGSFGSDINCYSEGGGPPSLRILCEPDTVTTVVFHGKCFYPHLYGRCRSVPLSPSLRNVHTLSSDDVSNDNFLLLHLITPSPLSTVEVCGVTNDNGIRLDSFLNDTSRLHRSGSTNSHPLSAPSTANILQEFTRLTKLTCGRRGDKWPQGHIPNFLSLLEFKLLYSTLAAIVSCVGSGREFFILTWVLSCSTVNPTREGYIKTYIICMYSYA
jgi:hypothetical protein